MTAAEPKLSPTSPIARWAWKCSPSKLTMPAGFLAAMLQRVQPERGRGRGIRMAEDAEDAAFVVEMVVVVRMVGRHLRPCAADAIGGASGLALSGHCRSAVPDPAARRRCSPATAGLPPDGGRLRIAASSCRAPSRSVSSALSRAARGAGSSACRPGGCCRSNSAWIDPGALLNQRLGARVAQPCRLLARRHQPGQRDVGEANQQQHRAASRRRSRATGRRRSARCPAPGARAARVISDSSSRATMKMTPPAATSAISGSEISSRAIGRA